MDNVIDPNSDDGASKICFSPSSRTAYKKLGLTLLLGLAILFVGAWVVTQTVSDLSSVHFFHLYFYLPAWLIALVFLSLLKRMYLVKDSQYQLTKSTLSHRASDLSWKFFESFRWNLLAYGYFGFLFILGLFETPLRVWALSLVVGIFLFLITLVYFFIFLDNGEDLEREVFRIDLKNVKALTICQNLWQKLFQTGHVHLHLGENRPLK